MMGPYIDIPGPEISAGSRMMSWLFDEYSKYKRFSPACVTGKVRDSRHTTYCISHWQEARLAVLCKPHTQAGKRCGVCLATRESGCTAYSSGPSLSAPLVSCNLAVG